MTKEETKPDDIIEIISNRYSLDWVSDDKHKINLKEIWGFELDWRGDSWHVVVVTKQASHHDPENIYAPKYYSYDLSHWVGHHEAAKLLANPKAVIKKIGNLHNSKNFYKELQKLIELSQKILKNNQ